MEIIKVKKQCYVGSRTQYNWKHLRVLTIDADVSKMRSTTKCKNSRVHSSVLPRVNFAQILEEDFMVLNKRCSIDYYYGMHNTCTKRNSCRTDMIQSTLEMFWKKFLIKATWFLLLLISCTIYDTFEDESKYHLWEHMLDIEIVISHPQ